MPMSQGNQLQYNQNQGYNQPSHSQQNQYGGYPSNGGPQLPPGWVQQWDQNSQRSYYLERSTGRSQWEPPANQHQGLQSPPYQGQDYNRQALSRDQSSYLNDQGYPPTQGRDYNQGPNNYDQAGPKQNPMSPPPVAVSHPGGPNYPIEAVENGEKKKSDSNLGAIAAAGAGGLLIGALAGAAMERHHIHHKGKSLRNILHVNWC